VWRRVLAGLWIAAVIITAIQGTLDHNNTFEIYRTSWHNLVAGRDLYGANPSHHDYFDYSPTFAVLFAPFAIVPFGLGLLLWNALNAGTLYWGLGRALNDDQAFVARIIVFGDTIGALQHGQSNALVAGLIVLAFSELVRARERAGAAALAIGAAIKVFPMDAAVFALWRPRRIPIVALWTLLFGAALLSLPLLFLSPRELAEQFSAWFARQPAMATGQYSVMDHLRRWTGLAMPNWPVQMLGAVFVAAPLLRAQFRDDSQVRLRLFALASVLMFSVLFNHKAESPTFVIAAAGVAIWFAVSERSRSTWSLLVFFLVGTVFASSEVIPHRIQERVFEPYHIKTLPVLAVWIVTQRALWRRTTSAAPPARGSGHGAPVT
jgi:hypothetical protein